MRGFCSFGESRVVIGVCDHDTKRGRSPYRTEGPRVPKKCRYGERPVFTDEADITRNKRGSAVTLLASRSKGELHYTKNCLWGGLRHFVRIVCIRMTSVE